MAGTNVFTADVMESVDMKDPRESMKKVKEIEDVSKNLQRFTTGGPVVGLDRFQQQGAANQYLTAENQRRQAAAPGMFGIAGAIDQRLTGAADTLAEAENKQTNRINDLYQQQAQALKEAEFEKKKGLSDLGYKYREIDWNMEKNQTNRDDALEDAYVKGIADDKMQELATAGELRIMDLDHYFRMKSNEIEQKFKDWENQTDIDWNKMLAEMAADAASFAALFEGAMGVITIAGQELYGR